MTQALITVNGSPGSNTDLPINTLVQLNNTGNGGESTYIWTIVDQPTGTADALSSAVIQNPTFTPKKEGTYLIDLIVNQGNPSEARDRVVCAVRQLKTRIRIPAAGETDEAGSKGYAGDGNVNFQLVDSLRADPGIVVAQLANAVAVRDVVHFTSSATIKAGLPGAEKVLVVDKALATQAYVLADPLGIVVAAVDGGALTAGRLAYIRVFGLVQGASVVNIDPGDPIFVSDTGTLSVTAGSNSRRVGNAVTGAAGVGDVFFSGV